MKLQLFYNFSLFFFFIFINLLLTDVVFLKKSNDLFLVLSSLFWIGSIIGFKLESRFSIAGSLIMLLITILLFIIKLETLAEKTAVWCYILLIIGVVQQLIEIRYKNPDLKNFDLYIKRLFNKK